MTADELDWIEESLGIRLSEIYRQLVAPFPVAKERGNRDTSAWDDADSLIELNRRVRSYDPNWPDWLFAIGQAEGDPSGYAIDTRDPAATVWWLQHMQSGPPSGPNGGTFASWFAQWILDASVDSPSTGLTRPGVILLLGLTSVGLAATLAWLYLVR